MAIQRKQYVVIGLGIFGTAVCRTLQGLGHEVLAIDESEEIVRRVHDDNLATHVVQANALNRHALQELDVGRFDAVVVAIGLDLEASILTVLNLIDLGVTRIIAKTANERHAEVLQRIGGPAVRTVNPEDEMGARLAHQLVGPEILEAVALDPDHSFAESPVPAELVGRTLQEGQLRARFGVLAIAIRRGGRLMIAPGADVRLEAQDRLVVLGPNEMLRKFSR